MTLKTLPTTTTPPPGPHTAPGLVPSTEPLGETTGLARAAGVISLGNIASRVLGLVRETVKADFFGAGGAVDAFTVAAFVPTMLYDLLVGGMVSSALVPVFSEYDAQEKRDALWGLVSVLLTFSAIVLSVAILLLWFFAEQVAFLLSSGSSPEVLALTARLLRITSPALLFLSISGLLTGVLYALKRFSLPAMTAAAFNATIVAATLLLGHHRFGIAAMALGLLLGAVAQVLLQLPGLRDARLRFHLDWRHPGLRRIGLLYAPIVLGLMLDVLVSRPISINLASRTGEGGISWLNYATTLIQFPHGLVATAVSIAILPTLSSHASVEDGNSDAFRSTLARGLRLVIVLIMPASVGLLVLAEPTIILLFEHGDFGLVDAGMTAWALRLYLIGLPFAAIDLLLVFAFYARQDTLTPALVGAYSIAVYLAVAILLLPRIGLFSLMVADSIKHMLHMGVSAFILRRRVGGLSDYGVRRTLLLTLLASAAMGILIFAVLQVVRQALPGTGAVSEVAAIALPGLAGASLYVLLVSAVRIEEVQLVWHIVRQKLTRRTLSAKQ